MRKLALFLSLVLCIGLQTLNAQTKAISGKVVDDLGEAIPGVSIIVKGTTTGTVTRPDGTYQLSVPQDATTLIYTFVGMTAQEVAIAGQSTINVTLSSNTEDLDEVVVTGYSVRRREVNTSAVAVVGGEELEAMVPSTSIDNMLQGRAAGVDAVALNGKPGATATVKVRGAVSLNTKGGDKAQPTYVVDGIYMDEDAMGMLNPSDIESMTVLKDAASAALYGSRGANGVVVITTKKGRKGDAKVNYTGRFGVANKIDDPYEMMNAREKIDYELAAYGDDAYTDDEIAQLLKYDHDWQDDILKEAKLQSHALTMSGGNEVTNYFVSLGYDKNTGIVERLDGFERISGRINTTSQVKKYLEIGTSIAVSNTESQEPRDRNNVQNPFSAMYGYNPYSPVYNHDDDGNIILDDNGDPIYNRTAYGFPILEALENNPESEINTRFIGNIYAKFKITDYLSYTSKYSGNYNRYKREYYVMPGSVLDGYVGDKSAPGSKTDNGRDTYEYTWLNQVSFDKSFDVHNISASALTEYNKGSWHSYRLGSKGYASDLLTTQDNSAEATDATTSKEEWSMFSIAAMANYDYDGKYLLGASLRRDGASRFGADTKYGTFYSISGGWNIASEQFMENVSWIDNLKLVASYGTLGNWNIGNYDAKGYYEFGKYNGQSAAIPTRRVTNADLTWEKQKSTNFGLETSMFDRRLNFTMDYFINTRTDFLFEVPKSYEGGSYTQFQNAGDMKTTGLELSISGDVIRTTDFKWNVSANITFLDYNVNQLDQPQIVIDGDHILKEGEEPFTNYLVRYAGVDPENGDALYYDIDGNITNTFSSGDKVALKGKSPLASSYGGFSTYLNYKGLDLSADFSFRLGNYIYNYMAYNMMSDGENAWQNQRKDALNYWKKPGDTALPKLNGNSNQTSDRFLQDGSYLRFRNLTLGYTLPNSIISKANLSKVRFFVQGQNLITWTGFEGDPEVSVGSGDSQLGATQNFIPGAFALYSYPAVRTYMFGVNVSF